MHTIRRPSRSFALRRPPNVTIIDHRHLPRPSQRVTDEARLIPNYQIAAIPSIRSADIILTVPTEALPQESLKTRNGPLAEMPGQSGQSLKKYLNCNHYSTWDWPPTGQALANWPPRLQYLHIAPFQKLHPSAFRLHPSVVSRTNSNTASPNIQTFGTPARRDACPLITLQVNRAAQTSQVTADCPEEVRNLVVPGIYPSERRALMRASASRSVSSTSSNPGAGVRNISSIFA